MTLVRVITPTLGVSPWLEQTVASVAALGASHVLIAPPGQVSALQARFGGVQVFAEPGGGMYAAINAGLRAPGEWDAFTYLNDDDLLLPEFGRVVQALDAQSGRAVVAYGGVRLIDGEGRRIGAIPISRQPSLNRLLYAQRIEPVYQHGSVVSRSAYEQIGGFDEAFRLCGDSEFFARATLAGVPFVCATPRAVAAFRLRPGQLTKARAAMLAERRRVDEKLQLLPARRGLPHHFARWRFRLANLPVYAERVLRYGFVSFDEVLAAGGPKRR